MHEKQCTQMLNLPSPDFGTGTRYSFEILQKYGKRVEFKFQKIFGANFYVRKSYREKTGRAGLFVPHPEQG